MLGLGLGLSKGTNLLSNLKLLTRNADFAFWGDKASGQSFPTLAERTLPNGVKNGIHIKNVSDDYALKSTDVTGFTSQINNNFVVLTNSCLSGIINFNTTDTLGLKMHSSISTPRNSLPFDNIDNVYKHSFDNGGWYIFLPKTVTTIEQARTLLTGTVIRYQLATPVDTINSPQVNPIQDLVGVVGKNLFDPHAIASKLPGSTISIVDGVSVLVLNGVNSGTVLVTGFIPNTAYTFKIRGRKADPLYQGGCFVIRYTDETSLPIYLSDSWTTITTTTNPLKSIKHIESSFGNGGRINYYDLTVTQLELGAVATAYEPYGKANGLLQGFAFTPASGYVDVVAPNGKTVTGIQGDSVNDVILLPSNAPNPVGLQDFGFAFVFKTGAILSYRCIASRVGTGLADAQWDLTLGSDNKLYFATGAISTVSNPIINENTFYKVLLIRKNGRLYIKINNTTDKDVANIVDLPQKNNTRLLARSSNADGSTNNAFFNGILCYADYNNGDNIDAWEVDQNKAIAKIYGL